MAEAGIAREVGGDQECVMLQSLGKTVVKACSGPSPRPTFPGSPGLGALFCVDDWCFRGEKVSLLVKIQMVQ